MRMGTVWSIIIVVLFMAELTLRSNAVLMSACSGNNVRLFRHIAIDHQSTGLSLYINGNRLIGFWTLQNVTISDGYTKRVLLDTFGDIWLLKLYPSDSAKYSILYNKTKYEVNLNVHVPPTAKCTPTIKREDDVLIASLKADDCGNPTPSVYWLDYHGMRYKGKSLAKLPPENKAGTYYACIKGPALRCASIGKPSEYCSAFEIDDIISETFTVSSLAKSSSAMVIVASIGFALLIVLTTYTNLKISLSFPKYTMCKQKPQRSPNSAYSKDHILCERRISLPNMISTGC